MLAVIDASLNKYVFTCLQNWVCKFVMLEWRSIIVGELNLFAFYLFVFWRWWWWWWRLMILWSFFIIILFSVCFSSHSWPDLHADVLWSYVQWIVSMCCARWFIRILAVVVQACGTVSSASSTWQLVIILVLRFVEKPWPRSWNCDNVCII